MAAIEGNFLRGHLETMILAMLERGEAHGFDILRRLDDQGKGALKLKDGSLYPAIYRLEEMKCVKGRWEGENAERRRGPRRRIYRLTAKGKRDLAVRRDAWKQFVSVIGEIVEEKS
jgi:PadR family transcriptional regulator